MNERAAQIIESSMNGMLAGDKERRGSVAVETTEEAFAELTRRHLDSAYRLAWAILGNDAEADDATQDAFALAWRNRRSLRQPDKFDAWFGRILVNVCREQLRARARSRVRELSTGWSSDELERSVADSSVRLSTIDAICRAMTRLDADHRIVVVLRYWADMSIEDIAVRLGVPVGTVKSRLHYALQTMRPKLEDAR